MRLPSTAPDLRDLMRGMSIMCDGSGDFLSAEDYLNPQDMEGCFFLDRVWARSELHLNSSFDKSC